MNNEPQVTIVTAANRGYFWGLFLVAASVRRWEFGTRLLIFHTGLDPAPERWLAQFERTELRAFRQDSPFGLHCRKAEAMLEADGDYIAWLDSDCLVIGDLNEFLLPTNGQMQARLRSRRETSLDLARFYQPGEPDGGIPRSILRRWRDDVGERESPRLDTTVPSNVFVLHSRFKPFLDHWHRQMRRVLDPGKGTLDVENPPYLLADESVLNSLLTFAHEAPEVSDYRLAVEDARHVAHFMGGPKPWVRWSPRNLYCLPYVLDLMDWVRRSGYEMPPLPPSLQSSRRVLSVLEAQVMGRWQAFASKVKGARRKLRRRIRRSGHW
jgi:hypothetical protein